MARVKKNDQVVNETIDLTPVEDIETKVDFSEVVNPPVEEIKEEVKVSTKKTVVIETECGPKVVEI